MNTMPLFHIDEKTVVAYRGPNLSPNDRETIKAILAITKNCSPNSFGKIRLQFDTTEFLNAYSGNPDIEAVRDSLKRIAAISLFKSNRNHLSMIPFIPSFECRFDDDSFKMEINAEAAQILRECDISHLLA